MSEEFNQPSEPNGLSQPEAPKPQEGISTVTGILITLVVAALIGAGIWYYYTYMVSPDLDKSATTTTTTPTKTTTDKTADWKTYTNTVMGFTLKIPSNYFTKEIPLTNAGDSIPQNVIISDIQKMSTGDNPYDSEKIHIEISKTKESLQTAQSGVKGGEAMDDFEVNGIKGKKFIDVNSPSAADVQPITFVTYLIPIGNYVFDITATNNDLKVQGNGNDTNFAIMNQIVKTFKATD